MTTTMAALAETYGCSSCSFQSQDFDVVARHASTCTGMQQSSGITEEPFVALQDAENPEESADDSTLQSDRGWSHRAIMLLIETFRLHMHDFSDSTKRKYEIWRDISKALQMKGYRVDGSACDTKMRALKRRYKIIKDNTKLSGRGAVKQWQYFTAMDDLMAGDPSVHPRFLETSLDVASTSTCTLLQQQQTSLSKTSEGSIQSSPLCSPPSTSSPSPSVSSPATESPTILTGESMMLLSSGKRPRKKKLEQEKLTIAVTKGHEKLLESMMSVSKERAAAIADFTSTLGSLQKTITDMQEERHIERTDLKKQIDEMKNHVLQLQEERHKEKEEMQRNHNNEMRELQQQHKEELQKMQQQMWQLQQQHKEESGKMQQQMWQLQQRHQDQLLKVMLHREQKN